MNESRERLLLSRISDGDAGDQEWTELESLAQTDPRLWRHLAEVQRDHISLMRALGGAMSNADSIPLPSQTRIEVVSTQARAVETTIETHQEWQPRLRGVGTWSGWAVAAVVAILATAQTNQPGTTFIPTPVHTAGLNSAQDAFQAYLDKGKESGQVAGEMPTKVLLDSRPATSGPGFEVIYLRQVMERVVVPDLYQVKGENELGQPTLVRCRTAVRSSM